MGTKTVNLNVRTNKDLKEKVGVILEELGLDHSTIINMLYRQIAMRKAIPFQINIPASTTIEALKELENDKNLKTYSDSDELFDELEIE